jgi:hypothetical protein
MSMAGAIMTKAELLRLKPGDLLRVNSPLISDRPQFALVVAGSGVNVSLSWRQHLVPNLPPFGRFL